jgi:septal ring factor EnvC (AmiA/AmiB activator)
MSRLPAVVSRLLLTVGLALVVLLATPALAPPDRRADLEDIRREISRLEGRLDEAQRKEATLQNRLETVEVELELQRQRLAEAEAARDLAVADVETTETEVARLETVLEEARTVLRERLVGLYRLGRQGYVRLFLSIESDTDLLAAVRTLRFLVRRDADAIRRYVESRDALEGERETLLARREEAERWADEERARRDRLVSVRRRQQKLLEEAEEERRSLARRTEELETKERRLTDLIHALAAAEGTVLEGRSIQQFEGVLDWPLKGEVTAGFGPRMDPRYGTRVPHNGIEIAAAPGTPTAAVYPGKVLFAAPLEGYGPTVVMLHPGRVFTLYAGLQSLRVSSEDVLSLGDVVGTSAERLYFEIRVDNRPQDPLRWLR